jgi:oxygen-independent coproporphyrinogen-3 oxidase
LENIYIDYLLKEINVTFKTYQGLKIDTIYFGGGTPSLISIENLRKITGLIRQFHSLNKDIEFTMEVDPGTFTADYLNDLVLMGVKQSFIFNRLIGYHWVSNLLMINY